MRACAPSRTKRDMRLALELHHRKMATTILDYQYLYDQISREEYENGIRELWGVSRHGGTGR